MDTKLERFFVFTIGEAKYGIDYRHFIETARVRDIISFPDSTELVIGIINLRGKVIPLIDIRSRFDENTRDFDERTSVIVVNIDGIAFGIIVDSVSDVMEIPHNEIESAPGNVNDNVIPYAKGMIKVDGNVIILLDVHRLISGSEIEQIRNMTKS